MGDTLNSQRLGRWFGRPQLAKKFNNLLFNSGQQVFLLTGEKGVGKTYCARFLAQLLLCPNSCLNKKEENTEAGLTNELATNTTNTNVESIWPSAFCSACPNCTYINAGTHPDLLEFNVDPKEKTIKTDIIRQHICNQMHFSPRLGGVRVFIIDADYLNETSQNVLLKSLEEINPKSYVLLTVTKVESLLLTLRSRAVEFQVEPLSHAELDSFMLAELGEKTSDNPYLQFILNLAAGSPGKVLEYWQNDDLKNKLLTVLAFNLSLFNGNLARINQMFYSQLADRETIYDYLSLMLSFWQSVLKYSQGLTLTHEWEFLSSDLHLIDVNINEAILRDTFQTLKMQSSETLANVVGLLTETKEALDCNVNLDIALTRMCIKLLETVNKQ